MSTEALVGHVKLSDIKRGKFESAISKLGVLLSIRAGQVFENLDSDPAFREQVVPYLIDPNKAYVDALLKHIGSPTGVDALNTVIAACNSFAVRNSIIRGIDRTQQNHRVFTSNIGVTAYADLERFEFRFEDFALKLLEDNGVVGILMLQHVVFELNLRIVVYGKLKEMNDRTPVNWAEMVKDFSTKYHSNDSHPTLMKWFKRRDVLNRMHDMACTQVDQVRPTSMPYKSIWYLTHEYASQKDRQ